MKSSYLAIGVLLAGVVSLVAFGLNYNASKSNTGNIIVTPDYVTKAQAAAILAEVEKTGKTPDEAAVRTVMTRHGVPSDRIKKVVIGITSSGGSKGYGIMLLDDPANEGAARQEMERVRMTGVKQGK